jgi:hypothetical protein
MSAALVNVLHANGPSSDRAVQMMLYGQFVGSWEGTLVYRDAEGVRRETSAGVHQSEARIGRLIASPCPPRATDTSSRRFGRAAIERHASQHRPGRASRAS